MPARAPEHLAEDCKDEGCDRFPCRMYHAGYEAGYRDGYAQGYADGEGAGFATGYAAGYQQGLADFEPQIIYITVKE